MVSLSLGYPDFESELAMAKQTGGEERYEQTRPVLNGEDLLEMQREIHEVYIKDEILRYLLELIRATREHPYLSRGASPRATLTVFSFGCYDPLFQISCIPPSDRTGGAHRGCRTGSAL